jgi:hypothetical protein
MNNNWVLPKISLCNVVFFKTSRVLKHIRLITIWWHYNYWLIWTAILQLVCCKILICVDASAMYFLGSPRRDTMFELPENTTSTGSIFENANPYNSLPTTSCRMAVQLGLQKWFKISISVSVFGLMNQVLQCMRVMITRSQHPFLFSYDLHLWLYFFCLYLNHPFIRVLFNNMLHTCSW